MFAVEVRIDFRVLKIICKFSLVGGARSKYHTIAISFLALLLSFNAQADSPLTSIKFWNLSNEKLVLKTGKKPGKKTLNKKMVDFLFDSNQSTFDKIALVNAIGWEFGSEVENAAIFMESAEKRYLSNLKKADKKSYDFEKEFFLSATNKEKRQLAFGQWEDDLYFVYLYLKSMDNYLDVSFFEDETEGLLPLDEESFSYIKALVAAQTSLFNQQFCDVGNAFGRGFYYGGDCLFDNVQIKNAVRLANNYLNQYQNYCEHIEYVVGNACMPTEIIAKPSQLLWVVNYPAFVYGKLVVYDSSNVEIDAHEIDGDDVVELELKNYSSGSYQIKIEDVDGNKYLFKLKIVQ